MVALMTNQNEDRIIARYLRENRDAMVDLTRRLCEFPTENPPGREYKALASFLAEQLNDMGLSVEVVPVPDEYLRRYTPKPCWEFPRYNVIARWDIGAKKTLHFNSHYDVVPATAGWKTDPFSPVIKQGRLFGRGTSDMKGCIAACIYAVKSLQACGVPPAWNLELSFTADEEIGGETGVGYIIEKGLIRPDAAVVCEGGADDAIMAGHRGVLWMDVMIQGLSAHGSNPGAGVNAFEKGHFLASRFLEYHQKCLARETRHPMDRSSARRPSMTLGGVSGGGTKVNTIPDNFHFTIDRRLIPEENVRQVKEEFFEIVRAAKRDDKKLKVLIEILMEFNAAITDSKSPLCEAAKSAVRRVLGKPGRLRIFGAFTDLHFFVNHAHCPTIGYGVDGDGIHGSREYLLVRSLVNTAGVYACIARTLSG